MTNAPTTAPATGTPVRVAFFGPFGTNTEQAVRSQPDLADQELVAFPSVPDVLDAVASGDVDCGVVPIENSIEGVVNFTQDALAFDYDLLITAGDGARHRALPRRSGRPARSRTSRSCCRSRSPPPSATASCASTCRGPRSGRRRARPRRPGSSPRVPGPTRWRSPRRWRPSATACPSSPPTSVTTTATRPASCWSPATASRPRPATTARRWSCSSAPTSRAR